MEAYDRIKQARVEGKAAYLNGVDYNDCPYPAHTAEWRAWREFYRMAKRGRI